MADQAKQADQASQPSGKQPDSGAPLSGGDMLDAINTHSDTTAKEAYAKAKENILGRPQGNDSVAGTEGQPGSARDGERKSKHPAARRKPSAKGQAELPNRQTGQELSSDSESGPEAPGGEPVKKERLSEGLARVAREEAKARKRLQGEHQRLQAYQTEVRGKLEEVGQFKKSVEQIHNGDVEGGLMALSKIVGYDLTYPSMTQAVLSGKLKKHEAPQSEEVNQHVQALNQRIQTLEQMVETSTQNGLSDKTEAYWSKANAVFSGDGMEHARFYAKQTGTPLRDLLAVYVTNTIQQTGRPPDPAEAARAIEGQAKAYHESVRDLFGQPQNYGRKAPPPVAFEEPLALDGGTGGGAYDIDESLRNDYSDDAMRKRGLLALRKIMAEANK